MAQAKSKAPLRERKRIHAFALSFQNEFLLSLSLSCLQQAQQHCMHAWFNNNAETATIYLNPPRESRPLLNPKHSNRMQCASVRPSVFWETQDEKHPSKPDMRFEQQCLSLRNQMHHLRMQPKCHYCRGRKIRVWESAGFARFLSSFGGRACCSSLSTSLSWLSDTRFSTMGGRQISKPRHTVPTSSPSHFL